MSKKTIGLSEALDWLLECESDNPDAISPGADDNLGFSTTGSDTALWTSWAPLTPAQINRAKEIEYHAYLRKLARESWNVDSRTVVR